MAIAAEIRVLVIRGDEQHILLASFLRVHRHRSGDCQDQEDCELFHCWDLMRRENALRARIMKIGLSVTLTQRRLGVQPDTTDGQAGSLTYCSHVAKRSLRRRMARR